jgi:hypothetical protein
MKTISILFISLLLLININDVEATEDARYFPGVFIGYTNAEHETYFTYGVEYEYKFNPYWGLGAIYEKIDDAHHGDGVSITLAELFYHPTNNIRMGLGAGKEKIGGSHPHSEDIYRASANYEFHVGDVGIEPTFAVDFINSEKAYILGVALIRPF